MKKQIVLLSFIFMFLVGVVSAVPLPHAFYGKVYYSDGTLIQESLEIRAEINNNSFNDFLEKGEYNLVVESESETGTVNFYIEGLNDSIGSHLFEAFEVTELNFNTDLQNPNATQPINPPSKPSEGNRGPSGGGGGGSSGSESFLTNQENQEFSEPGTEIPQTQKSAKKTQETTSASQEITGAVIRGVTDFVKSKKGITIIASLITIIGAFIAVKLNLIKKKF